MGCDFFWSGSCADAEQQRRAVELYQQFYSDATILEPKETQARVAVVGMGSHREVTIVERPLSFFGAVVYRSGPGFSGLLGRSQLMFDRFEGGRLCSVNGPDYGDEDVWAHYPFAIKEYFSRGVEAVITYSGHERVLADQAKQFAVLLQMLQHRYIPDLTVGDDYNIFRDITELGVSHLCNSNLTLDVTLEHVVVALHQNSSIRSPKTRLTPALLIYRKLNDEEAAIPIESPLLSVRTSKALRQAGIQTVGQLVDWSVLDVVKQKNIGRKSAYELEEVLRSLLDMDHNDQGAVQK